jgi:hypothetical protein
MPCGFGFALYRRQLISLWPPNRNWSILHPALAGWMAGGKSERVSAGKRKCDVRPGLQNIDTNRLASVTAYLDRSVCVAVCFGTCLGFKSRPPPTSPSLF